MPDLTEKEKALRGELYWAFVPELVRDRRRCQHACKRYTDAGEVSRRRLVELWRDVVDDKTPLPPPAPTPEEDEALFEDEPWVEGPVHIDYGTNLRFGKNVYVNFNATFLDTCIISIGSRTLIGPNVSFYSGTHPLDPELRNGTKGPELGKEIHVGEDCWIGGNVVILPGVTLGKGVVVGAGSVVTKDVPPFHVVAGNPARILRRIETNMDPEHRNQKAKHVDHETAKVPENELTVPAAAKEADSHVSGAEEPMAQLARQLDKMDFDRYNDAFNKG
ncbi:trimeric LpxA-like protein [Xylona heveae TC161]|uniref:Trimeric LpxA-like protein n=1 Tax=Xylona heveae (strain CBS 132557 / TC161) TaxID=1328760 RepID=A0A165G090_XYLHT|nr:trimeric LpxA-like protein [Xylona heveae TC161]KZF21588.1 trimeric LpxA-like protein [Xylona heveae TC161]